ncbi:hypothetical protein JXA48_01985 [Candidatus Woesearchaeota archaeon]|nr:hypothetical protein [Candidatus Woesearchaeota archaeon]
MVNKLGFILSILVLILLSSSFALAEDVYLVNSENWVDVYSGMLSSGLEGGRGFFINSETITGLTQVISEDDTIHLYQSELAPFIPNLDSQLSSLGYDVEERLISNNMNRDLDPKTGNYYLVSLDNPRITSSLAPLAIKENAWVLVVDIENVDEIVNKISNAQDVVAVGKFPRDVLVKIQPYLDEHIVNDDIYKDSQAIADKLGDSQNYVLTDGAFIESEFFLTKNPVLLTGTNKILTHTFNYLQSKDAKAVVLVGNELSVVGEQIRTQSNKEISVFVKFGQGDTGESGKVYALSTFPLPGLRIGLVAQQAIYDPSTKELIVTFKNIGNSGIYELTNLQIKNDEEELATTAGNEITFIAAGELLPMVFPMDIDLAYVTDETTVDLYTTFGLSPKELDTFLTMPNRYTPPYTMPLTVKEIEDDDSVLYVEDSSYYQNLNRVGVAITNPGDKEVYFTIKVQDIIVNGLKTTLSKEDSIKPGETKKVYLPAKLDPIDLDDNSIFDIVINYGKQPEFQFKAIRVEQPFKVVSGGRITGFVTGLGDGKPGNWVAIIAAVLVLFVLIRIVKHKSKKEEIKTSTKKSRK